MVPVGMIWLFLNADLLEIWHVTVANIQATLDRFIKFTQLKMIAKRPLGVQLDPRQHLEMHKHKLHEA